MSGYLLQPLQLLLGHQDFLKEWIVPMLAAASFCKYNRITANARLFRPATIIGMLVYPSLDEVLGANDDSSYGPLCDALKGFLFAGPKFVNYIN